MTLRSETHYGGGLFMQKDRAMRMCTKITAVMPALFPADSGVPARFLSG